MLVDTVAIIPARSGSKSVADKNLADLNGHPLIAYSIAAAKLSKQIQQVIVSTDSEAYAAIARQYGAEVPFIRPAGISTDLSTDRDFLLHAMNWYKKEHQYVPEFWAHLRPTTPIRDAEEIDQAIERIKQEKEKTSLRSAHRAPESPLKWFTLRQDNTFTGLLNDESTNKPKEMFDDVYIPNGYVDVLKASTVMSSKTIHGDRIQSFITDVAYEVDSLEELEYIRFQASKKSLPAMDYLLKFDKKEALA